jgi:uncharacterized NAD(P)/FAD-binding protein YdhS
MGSTARVENVTEVEIDQRGESGRRMLAVDRIIDCSGPRSDATLVEQKLLQQLLACGEVRPDFLRLGIDVTAEGAVIDSEGRAATDLYAIGPITKGMFWEIVAVPDLRIACADLAGRLLAG